MENVFNRRMFQQPIYAQSGTYVPTIEQIMNFYGGGFTADGEPKDMEAFQTAIQNANRANTAGLFEDGQPIDNLFSAGQEQKDFMKENNIDRMYDPIFKTYNTPGVMNFTPDDDNRNFLKDYLIQKDREKQQQENFKTGNSPADAIERAKQAAKIEEPTQFITELMNANQPATPARDVSEEQKFAQLQSDSKNRKDFAESFKTSGIANLTGGTTQPVTEDENIEIIKRNILQGTNLVTPKTEEYKNLSATDRMKVADALMQQKRKEVDLTKSSEEGFQNFIDAAGGSTEIAIELWNDIRNKGGEYVEYADEILEGWKNAISSGFNDDQKQSLTDQVNYLKSKSPVTGTTAPGQSSDLNIFGLDSKTLEEGAERYKERYKDSIFPEYIEEGANIFQNIFGASDMGDGELSKENKSLQDKRIEDQKQKDMRSVEEEYLKASGLKGVDTSIFKEKTEDKENVIKKTVDSLDAQMDKLFNDRDNNIIDEETFNKKLNVINDKKNDLLEKFNDTSAGKFLDEKTEEVSDYLKEKGQKLNDFKKQALEDGGDTNEDGKVGPIELFQYHLKQKKIEKQKQEGMRSVEEEYLKASGLDDERKKNAEKIVEESKVIKTEDDGVATIDDTEQEIVTTDEVKDSDNAINKADTATVTSDTVGLGAADGAVPAGTSAMQKLIADTAKETGYNFGGIDQTKDDLALKTIMYGLKLAMTPGKFTDAVMETGFDAVKNEINERYRTKASKQKFAGTLFNTMLAGKLDIEKEKVKAANKAVVQKKYDFGKNFERDVLLKIATGNPDKGLGFNLSGLGLDEEINEDNKGAKMFVQDIMNEMQMLANKAVTANPGTETVDPDILFNQAIENINPVYKIVTKDLFGIMYTLDEFAGGFLPGDWKQPKETTIERLRDETTSGATSTVSTISAAEREKILKQFKDFPVTEEIVTQQMKEHNKTRDEVIAEFAKLGADISGV